jgi:hypothetical protein
MVLCVMWNRAGRRRKAVGFKIVRVESDHPHSRFSAVLTFMTLDTIVGLAFTSWKATARSALTQFHFLSQLSQEWLFHLTLA